MSEGNSYVKWWQLISTSLVVLGLVITISIYANSSLYCAITRVDDKRENDKQELKVEIKELGKGLSDKLDNLAAELYFLEGRGDIKMKNSVRE